MKTSLMISVAAFSILALQHHAVAQNSDDHLKYELPPKTEKLGPASGMDDSEWYNYLLPGSDHKWENVVGQENYRHNQLIKRVLMKDGVLHGPQKTWHQNGTLKSESFYNAGVMDGTFREWNEKGQLIAQYVMVRGAGRKRVYGDDGKLVHDEPFQDSKSEGLCFSVESSEGHISLRWAKKGNSYRRAFGFDPPNTLSGLTSFSENGAVQGPYVTYSSGELSSKGWFLQGSPVTEAEYKSAALRDPTLEPYFSDVREYAKLVTPEIKEALEYYRKMPPVKIPLELDAQGHPVVRAK